MTESIWGQLNDLGMSRIRSIKEWGVDPSHLRGRDEEYLRARIQQEQSFRQRRMNMGRAGQDSIRPDIGHALQAQMQARIQKEAVPLDPGYHGITPRQLRPYPNGSNLPAYLQPRPNGSIMPWHLQPYPNGSNMPERLQPNPNGSILPRRFSH